MFDKKSANEVGDVEKREKGNFEVKILFQIKPDLKIKNKTLKYLSLSHLPYTHTFKRTPS